MTNGTLSNVAMQTINLAVINSPTVLTRVIQIVSRRKVEIRQLVAIVQQDAPQDVTIEMCLIASGEQMRLLKGQFEKQIDVIAVL